MLLPVTHATSSENAIRSLPPCDLRSGLNPLRKSYQHFSSSICSSVVVAGCVGGDAPVLQRGFEYTTAVELIHGGAVDLLPGGLALGELRDAFLPLAALYLLIGDQHIAASLIEVDAYGI